MSRTFRVLWKQASSGWFNFNWPGVINETSVVQISACEADPGFPLDVISHDVDFANKIGGLRWRGDASIYVKNIRPHASGGGGVEFVLEVDWDAPLRVITDITVLDPILDTRNDATIV